MNNSATTSTNFQCKPSSSQYAPINSPKSQSTLKQSSPSKQNASSSLLNIPSFLQDDFFTFVNKKAVDTLIPYGYRLVVTWGCKKPAEETFMEYLQRHQPPEQWEKYKKRWLSGDLDKLEMKECGSFDVTFLWKLIPEVCENLAKSGSSEWTEKSDGKLECILKHTKDLRNSVMHEPEGAAISPEILNEVEVALLKLIDLAGTLYSVVAKNVDNEKKNIKAKAKEIRELFMSDKEKRMSQLQKKMKIDGLREMRERWEKIYDKVELPFSNTKVSRCAVFHEIKFFTNNESEYSKEIKCNDLFQLKSDFEDDVNSLVIEGAAGSGKTTLVKRLTQDFLQSENEVDNIFCGVSVFPLIIFVECRNPTVESLGQLIKQNLPATTKSLDISEVIDAIVDLGALIVIDGIDEWNPSSRKLVLEILERFNLNERTMLVFTSRPNATEDIRSELNLRSFSHKLINIKEITTQAEQIEFLNKYQTAISSIETHELINAFTSLGELSRTLVYPIHLALFCHLYSQSAEEIASWTSEVSIMKQTLKLCESKMAERIKSISNANIITDMIMEASCDLSLRCLQLNKLTIDKETMDDFCKECFRTVGKDVPFQSVLSCLFIRRTSFYSRADDLYGYFHKSQQECMAATSITAKLKKKFKISIQDIIEEIVGQKVEKDDFKRYLNVFKFVLVDLSNLQSTGDKTLSLRLPELKEILTAAGANFPYWAEVLEDRCGRSDELIRAAADVAATVADNEARPTSGRKHSGKWDVRNSRQAAAAGRMMPHRQPSQLDVLAPLWDSEIGPVIDALMPVITKHFSEELLLQLVNSHNNFIPCDQTLLLLSEASCKLTHFIGCVSGVQATLVLARLVRECRRPCLRISLPPSLWAHHNLMHLQAHHLELNVTAKHYLPFNGVAPRLPLPTGAALTLVIKPPLVLEGAASFIVALAPMDQRYSKLELQEYPALAPDQLQHQLRLLLQRLQAEGLRTHMAGGQTKWERSFSTWEWGGRGHMCLKLLISDQPPQ